MCSVKRTFTFTLFGHDLRILLYLEEEELYLWRVFDNQSCGSFHLFVFIGGVPIGK